MDLSNNSLTGDFPTVLYGCSSLQFLDLSNNEFTGSLPGGINRLSREMQRLNLSSNGFIGNVPSAIGGFPNLKSLILDTNKFNGSYPAVAISGLMGLEELTLATNPFMPGPVPAEFSKLTNLKLLWLSGMNLTGEIPDGLSALTELTLLDLAMNKMQGAIPGWVWQLQKLEKLYLYANKFTGGIGPNITAISMLELDLSTNELTGPIPESIGNMKKLELLYLYFNNITGPIPASVGLLPNLIDIRLFHNRLSGPLPQELGKHSPLGNLEVSNNFLSGEVPETLCTNKKLYDIVLYNNSFSGALPANLGECDTLNNIMIYNNRFTGDFPKKIWSFSGLTNIEIQNNNFTGTLPSVISYNISRIQVEDNKFFGAIPKSATRLKVFSAQNNMFSGALPEDMTALTNLTDLNLSRNHISGSIPPSIQGLTRLNSLDLSSNHISGEIPAALGSLTVLNILDLSNNKLSNDIPQELNNLHLNFLNLSANQLSGEVPKSLQSPSYNHSFLGNHGLCTGVIATGYNLPIQKCTGAHGSDHDHNATTMIILLAVLPIFAFVALAAIGWLLFRCRNGRRDATSWKMTPFTTLEFSQHDILGKMCEGNVIGRGGSGKVYLVHLGGDEGRHGTVAVKKIECSGKPEKKLDKQFESEVRALSDLRHGNVIGLLCCISSQETMLLVYEFMENASLDRWLDRRKRAHQLDWPTRLSIAIDVASGLSYMHHGFPSPVIHRDVKSSNILLDCSFRAKIADFGFARVLANAGKSESASAVCGTFGYMAPEYACMGKVSEKVDVYSFGVVLLELTTCRGPLYGDAESGNCLAKWASNRAGDPLTELQDGEIQDPDHLKVMWAVFELAVACTGEDAPSRPPMSEVFLRLLQFGQSRMMAGGEGKVEEVFDVGVDSSESPMSEVFLRLLQFGQSRMMASGEGKVEEVFDVGVDSSESCAV